MAARTYEFNFGPANAGKAPAWIYFVRQDNGAPLVQPAIREAPWGNGSYLWDYDWASSPVDTISVMMEVDGVSEEDVLSGVRPAAYPGTGSRLIRTYEVNFGPENAGQVAAFAYYVRQDTGAALAQPAIREAPWGGGAYLFEINWAAVPSIDTISWGMDVNGIRQSDVAVAVVGAGVGLTLSDAVAELENLISEEVDESDLVTPAQARSFLRRANRVVWQHAAMTQAEPWEIRSGDLVIPASDKLAFIDVSTPGIHKIRYVEAKRGDLYYPIWPLAQQDRWRYDLFTPREVLDFRWYIEGNALRLSPANKEAITVRVSYLPVLADPADTDMLLGGVAPEYCDAVVTKAAILAYAKDENSATTWRAEYEEQLGLMKQSLAQQQGRESRRVHRASDY